MQKKVKVSPKARTRSTAKKAKALTKREAAKKFKQHATLALYYAGLTID